MERPVKNVDGTLAKPGDLQIVLLSHSRQPNRSRDIVLTYSDLPTAVWANHPKSNHYRNLNHGNFTST